MLTVPTRSVFRAALADFKLSRLIQSFQVLELLADRLRDVHSNLIEETHPSFVLRWLSFLAIRMVRPRVVPFDEYRAFTVHLLSQPSLVLHLILSEAVFEAQLLVFLLFKTIESISFFLIILFRYRHDLELNVLGLPT